MASGRLSVFNFLNDESPVMDSSVDDVCDNGSVDLAFGSTQVIFDALTTAEENAARAALQADSDNTQQESFYMFGEPESELFPDLCNADQSPAMLDMSSPQAALDSDAENFLSLGFTTLPLAISLMKSREEKRQDIEDGHYRTRFNRAKGDAFTLAEYRREALMSYHMKKDVGKISNDPRKKGTLYPCRKKFADSRPRVQGRFVTIKHEEAESPQLRPVI
jgi:hypothetical protein